MGRPHFRYSPWDGSQAGFELDAYDVLEQLTDDLLYNGDLRSALRRMMTQGFEDANGKPTQGLREILKYLRGARQDRLDRFDLGGVYDQISGQLNEVLQMERDALDERLAQANAMDDGLPDADTDSAPMDSRSSELIRASSLEKHLELDMLPEDLAGRVKGLENYEFVSPEAAALFETLSERLREQLMSNYVNQLTDAVQGMSGAQMDRMKDMMAELNAMLEQRQRGETPDFEGFMERFGDMFPGEPQTLDELLEIMARQMAAAQAMFNSMTPEQRDQMRRLSEQLLEDMDLRWQMDQLSDNLRQAFPDAGWGAQYSFDGADPLDWSMASSIMGELGDLDQIERMIQSAAEPGALAEIDFDRVRELIGEQEAESLERISRLASELQDAGLVEHREGRLELTPRGMRRLGQDALSQLFRKLDKDLLGRHEVDSRGFGHERSLSDAPLPMGRLLRPEPRTHDSQRDPARRTIACPTVAGRLRDRGDRERRPHLDCPDARPVAVDADARQLPASQEGHHGASFADLDAVPVGLSGHGRVLRVCKGDHR
ncbi:MAG: hypothetical protein R2735_13275 [Microthrixaceae bacterium]